MLENEDFVINKDGSKMIEIIGQSFYADESTIFGSINTKYIQREIEWYKSTSRNVYDMPKTPKIWKDISDKNGFINSNYGWCIFTEENGDQYKNVIRELRKNKDSRRASMIYTRPMMHSDYNKNGMSDFMCTNAVTYFIRNNRLSCNVQMRSNDSIFGYKNDLAWQQYILDKLKSELEIDYTELQLGNIVWNSASLHVYERHFYLVDNYNKTGNSSILKKDYTGKWK